MRVIVHVPAALREYSGGVGKLQLDVEHSQGSTVAAIFDCLRTRHPGVVERALDERGHVREHVNVFVDSDSIRAGAALGLATPVSAGSEVWILPAVSGGS